MKKKRELTWKDLERGKNELEKLFESCDYAEGRFLIRRSKEDNYIFLECDEKEALNCSAKEGPIIKHKISIGSGKISGLEVCAFARRVYDVLISRELDESEILDIGDVRWGLEKWKDQQLDKIKFFRSYESVYDIKPNLLTFGISEIDTLSEERKKIAIKILDEESEKLRVGGAVRIDGVRNLRELGLLARLDDVFRYTGDFYCTMYPETHGFKRDLERAVQYEMLSIL